VIHLHLGPKKWDPAWDQGPREGAFHCQCRFHTNAWGHPSFPLRGRWERSAKNGEQIPSPHSPASTVPHVKRACTPSNAIGRPSFRVLLLKLRPFLCGDCVWARKWPSVSKATPQPKSERRKAESGSTPPSLARPLALQSSSRTLVMIFRGDLTYGFFSAIPAP
jgi:hypothetical protein